MNFLQPGQGINGLDTQTSDLDSSWNTPGPGAVELMQETVLATLESPVAYRPPSQVQTPNSQPRKRLVIIDVSKFIKSEYSHPRCIRRLRFSRLQKLEAH
jgi:hypothetical protein